MISIVEAVKRFEEYIKRELTKEEYDIFSYGYSYGVNDAFKNEECIKKEKMW